MHKQYQIGIALRVALKNIPITYNEFIRMECKAAKLTQEQFAENSGIDLHALRDLEQEKDNITFHKINQVLAMFDMEAVLGTKWDD